MSSQERLVSPQSSSSTQTSGPSSADSGFQPQHQQTSSNNNQHQLTSTTTTTTNSNSQHEPELAMTTNTFQIRTQNRRHLDFDNFYDLSDPKAAERSKWSGPFHFIQAADSQFGMIDSYKHRRSEPGWSEEMELCQRLLQTCSQMKPKPKFLIICGDLVDAWPSTELRRKQILDFKRIFSEADPEIPLVCVCGNHDVGDQPTLGSIIEYNKDFGDDYFYFTTNDCLFIVINSQFYQHREFVTDLADEQDKWLEGILEKCKLFRYSFVFEHIPWFLEDPGEENDYFNIRKEVRGKWLQRFYEAGVTKILCGHYHRNAGGWFKDMEQVVTSAIGAQMGSDESGVRVVRVLDKSVEHDYYAMQNLPHEINFSNTKQDTTKQPSS